MVEKRSKYLIEEAERIDLRYYKIKVHGKYYIIDYSNPRDIRNYFPGLFPEVTRSWKLFPVESITYSTSLDDAKKVRESKIRWEVVIFLIYLFNVMFFPDKYNFSSLTYNSNIIKNWLLTITIVFIGAIVILVSLYTKGSTHVFITKEYVWLNKIEKDHQNSKARLSVLIICKWFLSYLVCIVMFGLVGLGSSSYSQLFVFFIIPVYGLLFSKFITFEPIKSKNKYQILKEERE